MTNFNSSNPLGYMGINIPQQPAFLGGNTRAPNFSDVHEPGTQWQEGDGVGAKIWITTGQGNWILETSSTGDIVDIAVPNGTSPVTADANGLITFTSTDSSVTITGSTNSIDFTTNFTDLIFTENTGTATASSNNLFVVGGPNSSTSNNRPIQTSGSGNTIAITAKTAMSAASGNDATNGVSTFSNVDFSVDVSGFVQLAISPFTSINIQKFLTSGTYTATTGMKYCIVQVVGAGGGGGGAASTTSGQSAGGGGGAGGYALGLFTYAQANGQTVTIGTGGGGGSGSSTGTTGGTSSFGALLVCNGGTGGVGSSIDSSGGLSLGGVGGTFSGSYINGFNGNQGLTGTWANSGAGPGQVFACTGQGANSLFGSGGANSGTNGTSSGDGNNGNGYGSGGSGAYISGIPTSSNTGGSGANGYVLITEYISVT